MRIYLLDLGSLVIDRSDVLWHIDVGTPVRFPVYGVYIDHPDGKFVFDTGFDHERSIAEGRVVGVRAGSGAAQAGLVDGMKLASWSVSFGRADVPIEMRVRDGSAGERTISFLPRGEVVAGRRFRLRGE